MHNAATTSRGVAGELFKPTQARARVLRENYCISNEPAPSAGVAGELFIVKQFLVPG